MIAGILQVRHANHFGSNSKTIPLWLKLIFTVQFFASIFYNLFTDNAESLLWFCNVAIILMFFAVWSNNRLLISIVTVSIIGPQLVWQVDYFFRVFTGDSLLGNTDYMFDPRVSLFGKLISLFHIWMPYLLLYSLYITGYDKRAFRFQCIIACLVLIGSYLATSSMFGKGGNLNMIYGPDSYTPQTWMPGWLWLFGGMAYCCICIYLPTHFILKKMFRRNNIAGTNFVMSNS